MIEERCTLNVQRKNYNGIDLIKFVCAVLVALIHIAPFLAPIGGEITESQSHFNFLLQNGICRLGVPFFFTSSGFFLFKKMSPGEIDLDAIKNYCFKTFRLLGIWSVLLFFGWTGHLWYLGATIIAVTLLSLCFHFKMKYKHLFPLAIILYAFGMLGDSYYGFIKPLTSFSIFDLALKAYFLFFETTRNGVFMGFIFVLLGACFAHNKIKLKPLVAVFGLVVSIVLLLIEVFLVERYLTPTDHNMFIFLLPVVFFLFSFALTIQLKDRPVYKRLRTVGVLVYFLHILVNSLIHYVVNGIYIFLNLNIKPFQCAITLLATLLISSFIEWLSHKDKFKWINWFLS